RVVPIIPALEGQPAPGFVVGRMISEPSTVAIVAPDTRVRQGAEATTEPISVAGARTRVRDVVTVGVADSAVRLAQPLSATVVVEITPAPVWRSAPDAPVGCRHLGSDLHAQVTPPVVRVTGLCSRARVSGAH